MTLPDPTNQSTSPLLANRRRWIRKLGPLLAFIVVTLFFSITDAVRHSSDGRANFTTMRNMRTVLVQTAPVAIAALGMTLVIISGGIDLSVGSTTALCATVLAYGLKSGMSPGLALICCLATGLGCGVINGIAVGALRLLPFIVTLGTMTIYVGLAKLVADETTVRPALDAIPFWMKGWLSLLPTDQWPSVNWGAPIGVWCVIPFATIVFVILRWHQFGRAVFAVGSNELTARLCGLSIPKTKLVVYTIAGLLSGVAGFYQFSRLSVGNPTSGNGLELKVIAAVVVGGASLRGGEGNIQGTLIGSLLMAVMASGCTALNISNPTQDVVIGIIIVAAVLIDRWQMQEAR